MSALKEIQKIHLSLNEKDHFQKIIYQHYTANGRAFPWRNTWDPYRIVVSEIMLQQTQTHRVLSKYEVFIQTLSTFQALADAHLQDVLSLWQGLGYNRRGIALHKIAKKIVTEFDGRLPNDPDILVEFPGIGPATASSITAFAFNRPTVFIETNIRAVFIHFFFQNRTDVHDKEIIPLVEQTLDGANPRQWYYALMDYGVMLKKHFKNPARKSIHHTKQSKFEGSDRQIRGAIVRVLTKKEGCFIQELIQEVGNDLKKNLEHTRYQKILNQLIQEGFVSKKGNKITISSNDS